uniref:Uncharacterized protein n=1 Tax=Arundo donax TaxID=35708 RepID=A0A0A9KNJ2_ARUDO
MTWQPLILLRLLHHCIPGQLVPLLRHQHHPHPHYLLRSYLSTTRLHKIHQQFDHHHLHQAPLSRIPQTLCLVREVLLVLPLHLLRHSHLVQRTVAQPTLGVLEVCVPTSNLRGHH